MSYVGVQHMAITPLLPTAKRNAAVRWSQAYLRYNINLIPCWKIKMGFLSSFQRYLTALTSSYIIRLQSTTHNNNNQIHLQSILHKLYLMIWSQSFNQYFIHQSLLMILRLIDIQSSFNRLTYVSLILYKIMIWYSLHSSIVVDDITFIHSFIDTFNDSLLSHYVRH